MVRALISVITAKPADARKQPLLLDDLAGGFGTLLPFVCDMLKGSSCQNATFEDVGCREQAHWVSWMALG
ncbi:hypothetical protein D2V17_19400 [Aurantiacibacter xanthus]|uniref:Uncharacterized protein n=1 Tax=Aurantiacibacter xanthus TaxID=1784712 RepID=A0A3A1P0N8_9SPHN|nr:hypothetical protein D2V17_19400 [Aurantiacibacter xanthus]